MRSFGLRYGVIAALFGTLVACGAAGDDGTGSSESAHTEASFTNDNSPFGWAASSYEEFRSSAAGLGGGELPGALADDDPLTVRMQAWVDRVDAIVRPTVQAKTGQPLAAPKPIAKVLVSKSTFNAWVSGVPACLGAPLAGDHQPGWSAYLDRDHVYAMGNACLHPAGWSAEALTKYWNADKPACQLALADGKLTTKGTTCTVDPGVTGGDDVAIATTGQYIQFTTDLLAELDEATVALVVAHELGHYYLGHTTAKGTAKYGFWYTRSDGQQATPTRAPNTADLEAAYKEVVQQGRPLGGPSFGARYSARMHAMLVAGLGPILKGRTEPDFACAAARDALGPWTDVILASEAPPAEAQAAFLDYEKKLAACAPKIALGGDPGAKAISAGEVLFAAAANRPGPKAKVSLKWGDDLGAFLDRLDLQAKDLDAKAQRLLARVRDNKVGLYTTEQAADEFAMEMAVEMGFTADEAVQSWLGFMQAVDRVYARSYTPEQLAEWRKTSGEVDATTCGAMLAAGWKNADGSKMTVSMGQLDEPHHANCYRLYNLWRKGQAHHDTPADKPAALEPAWDTLKAKAGELAATAAW